MARQIVFVIHSLQHGGAERVAAMLVNHWAQQGHAVTLVTLDDAHKDSYAIDPAVQRVAWGVMKDSPTLFHAIVNNWRRIRVLRQTIADAHPDAVISFTDKTNVLTLLAARPLPVDVLVAERTDPRRHAIGRTWSFLRRWTYPECSALVVQTQSIRDFVQPWVKGKPVHAIPNAAPPCEAVSGGQAPNVVFGASPFLHIAAMGRLTEEKGFDLLIRAFARIAEAHPQWCLQILGEGPLRATLQQLVADVGLGERVALAGWVSEPREVLRQASLFVLSSRYEGFPNALLEAMACGLPVISFDCDSGPGEIIRNGVDGLLVPQEDVDALAAALDRLMSDEAERQRLASHAGDVIERFSVDRFFRQWDAALESVLQGRREQPSETESGRA